MPEERVLTGRVLQAYGNRFIVQTADGTYDCGLRGKLRLTTRAGTAPVVVGDRVRFTVEEEPYGMIEEVQERNNKLSRPDVDDPESEQVIAANVEQMVVVASVDKPRLKMGVIDRFLLAAEKSGMHGCVCINKIDLAPPEKYQPALEIYRRAGYSVVACSAKTGEGIDRVREAVRLKTSLFVGHSGVGKSSIINSLQPGLQIRTGDISHATGKGIHTTAAVQLHPLGFGGYIADTPGLREIGLWNIPPQALSRLYPEMAPYLGNCRFRNCVHLGEPECAVKEAVAAGDIAGERYEGYVRIYKSLL